MHVDGKLRQFLVKLGKRAHDLRHVLQRRILLLDDVLIRQEVLELVAVSLRTRRTLWRAEVMEGRR